MTSASQLTRNAWRMLADTADRHARRRSGLVFGTGHAASPTVYFLTPDHPTPAGGIRVIYRHVDILNASGMSATVLHRRPGFRCKWFTNETRVTHTGAVVVRHNDLLVVPEVEIDVLAGIPKGARHVIFNQNSHLTWSHGADRVAEFYTGRDLAGVVCVSDHNRDMLMKAFPGSPVRRIHLGIDPLLFSPGGGRRTRHIAYMPRRGSDDARLVLAILRSRRALDGWEVSELQDLSHEQVAERLRTASIFLAFTRQEGFGLPAAEAMACGCYVIGNDGFGGREFFRPGISARIEAGDVAGFVDAVEEAVRKGREDADWCAARGRRASRFVLGEYALDRERREVAALYVEFMSSRDRISEVSL